MRNTFEKSAYSEPVDHSAIEQEWRALGFSFGVFQDPPGQEWNDFAHSTDEYVIVAAGSLTISVGPETAQCKTGDMVWIPKGTLHSLKTTSLGGSVWLYGYDHND